MFMTEPMPQVQELLDSADLAFDADDFREGSRLMWEATRVAVAAIAAQHGWPCDGLEEIKEVVYRLDGVDDAGNPNAGSWHFGHFGVADTFREHAETDEWEYPEFQWGEAAFRMGRKSVKHFVAFLTQYAESRHKVQ